jgi:hypothetical protein
MSDIVERLRAVPDLRSGVANAGICREAADEIERLRARNAEHEARYDALEAKEEYHKRDAGRLRRLEKSARIVVKTFQKDEAQGYRSRDRQYAIDMLGPYFVNEQQAKPRVEQDAHSDTTGWFKRESK